MVNFSETQESFIFIPKIETMRSMIHNSSSDPVLIKKISIKIWSLRDEIEARIQEKLDAGEIVPENLQQGLKELRREYTGKKKESQPNNVLELKPSNDLPPEGEDEMAKAMAEAMNAPEDAPTTDEPQSEEASTETTENTENVVSMNAEGVKNSSEASTENQNVVEIRIEPPHNLSEDKMYRGKTVLSEISMGKMFFFSNKSFTEGQSIVIQFCIPKTFVVNADVLYCRPFNIKSRIISQNNYAYRMLVKFNFLHEGERALLRQFIKSIEPEVTKVTKVVKKVEAAQAEEDDSGFNDLDDLGL